MSERGLSTKKWGPSAWVFLHSVAQRYPRNPTEEDKNNYRNFYENIENMLPCGKCRESYTKYIQILPIRFFLSRREDLILWLYTIHNFVNFKLIGQGYDIQNIPSLAEVYEHYENFAGS